MPTADRGELGNIMIVLRLMGPAGTSLCRLGEIFAGKAVLINHTDSVYQAVVVSLAASITSEVQDGDSIFRTPQNSPFTTLDDLPVSFPGSRTSKQRHAPKL